MDVDAVMRRPRMSAGCHATLRNMCESFVSASVLRPALPTLHEAALHVPGRSRGCVHARGKHAINRDGLWMFTF